MKYVRARSALALVIGVPLYIILTTGCATAHGVPLYDGEPLIPEVQGDSVTLVPLTIANNRSTDAIDPHLYLLGLGRHSLGIVKGVTTRTLLVDKSWFGADGCMQVVAHWVGGRDWVSERFCFHKGDSIDVYLQSLLSTSSAWSHR